ncbi:hypothetical protein J6590_004642 [Homalodisca vitripennis]|nr:hypothetical protein J6590_004642 [Homalodisca vitripennis]
MTDSRVVDLGVPHPLHHYVNAPEDPIHAKECYCPRKLSCYDCFCPYCFIYRRPQGGLNLMDALVTIKSSVESSGP